jgi:hypothetical protein
MIRMHSMLAVFAMSAGIAWGQSAWYNYPSNSTISITSGGNVGIGMSSPGSNYALDVTGNIHASNAFVFNDGKYAFVNNGGAPVLATCCGGTTAMYSGSNAWGVRNSTDSAWLMYATNGGNVGIGTTTPQSLLDLNGALTLRDRGDTCCTQLVMSETSGQQTHLYSYSWGGFQIHKYGTGSVNGAVLTILPTGNVGIGTTSPIYPLSVKGAIGAGEVIITSTTSWSDYVFDPGYRLQPLADLNAYIQANHHLPDIPSAKEVKEKGLGVGEMEAKLLAKIEELTLRMIQQAKDNQELREDNRELQDRIARLEGRSAAADPPAVREKVN